MTVRANIAQTVAAARRREMAPFAALVFAAALCGVAFAGLWMVGAVRLSFHSTSQIVAWITLNHYSKQQEVFNLAVAVVGLPAGLLGAWWAWILGAAWGVRLARCAPSRLLKQLALASTGFFALTPALARLEAPSPRPLLVALAGVLLAGLALVAFNRRFGVNHPALHPDLAVAVTKQTESPPPRRPPHRTLRLLQLTLVWVLLPAIIYCLSYKNRLNNDLDYFNQFHEGERLYPMWVMRHGGIPYRDAHVQHGFFRNALVPQLGAKLFGPTLEGLRRIEDMVWPLGVVSVYLAGAALLGSKLISSLVLALFLFSWRVDIPERLLFGCLSIAVMAVAIRRADLWNLLRPPEARHAATTRLPNLRRILARGWLLMLSGALASLAFWSSVETGLFTWAGMIIFLMVVAALAPGGGLRARARPVGAFVAGALLGLAIVGVYFAWHGALYDVLRNVYQQCAYQGETWGVPFPNLLEAAPLRAGEDWKAWAGFLRSDTALMYFPFVSLLMAEAWLAWLWVHGRLWTSPRGWRLLLVTCVGLCFSRGLLGRSDDQHMYNGVVFQMLICTMAFDAGLGLIGRRVAAFRADASPHPMTVLSLFCAIIPMVLVGQFLGETYRPLEALRQRTPYALQGLGYALFPAGPRREPFPGAGRISVPRDQSDRVRRVVAFIQEHTQPGEAIVNFSSQATVLFFADRPSATRYFLPCYAPTPALQREAIAQIEQRRPRLVYFGVGHGFDGSENKDRQWLIYGYLRENYQSIGRVEDIEFLWRKGEPR